MMKRIVPLLCFLCCLVGYTGCDSPQGGLVTDQGTMTFEELQEMQAKGLARQAKDAGEKVKEEEVDPGL
ncbi:hypothetical protein [Rhodopirellula sp. SWK7]|uniref:hypothetical protein n=1 Tax=Rhodopirellula sp. SWK7 TaxID=595460 RepID=UPI0002BF90D8|nr:hypothetical protein [Rhodopirellula sp. SWK7]EMI43664.1 hypothetical protein RRSWK_03826 [Rhodopirellula sp. SWK7]